MSQYITPQVFMDLYQDFTGYAHGDYPPNKRAIAQDLAQALSEGSGAFEEGELIVATSNGIYVYSPLDNHQLLASASIRTAPNSGFYEVTSISHIGPAMAYLATLNELGQDYTHHISELHKHLKLVQVENNKKPDAHWLYQLNCHAWRKREEPIKNMIAYGLSLAINYLDRIKTTPKLFSTDDLVAHFFDSHTDEYPIPFNTVMIGTFSLIALQSAFQIYTALKKANINWKNAKVLLHNQAGTNYTAGLSAQTNWLYPTIHAIGSPHLKKERIMIIPYATIPPSVGMEVLPKEDFDYLTKNIWGALFARPQVTKRAFKNIEDIPPQIPKPIPGDYEVTKAHQIGDFVKRLNYKAH